MRLQVAKRGLKRFVDVHADLIDDDPSRLQDGSLLEDSDLHIRSVCFSPTAKTVQLSGRSCSSIRRGYRRLKLLEGLIYGNKCNRPE